jgi:hypothetical protein
MRPAGQRRAVISLVAPSCLGGTSYAAITSRGKNVKNGR